MQLSTYTTIFPSTDDPSTLILFSTRNAAIVEIPRANFRSIAKLSPRDRRLLAKLGLIVPDQQAERREMLGFIEELNCLNRTLSIKAVMGLDCNLGCRYCFEGKRKGPYVMTKETADCLVDFIEGKIERQRIEEIHIVFYGGEPLLHRRLIAYIAKKVKSLAGQRKIPFDFSLQTNATLLTKEAVRQLRPLGLTGAYVSLDGPRRTHDAARPYKSGRGSFDRIVSNLRDVCRLIDIKVSGNFSSENFDTFPELLDFMVDSGLGPERIPTVGFYPVVSERQDLAPPGFYGGCASVNEPWLFDAAVSLREEILRRGYRDEGVAPGVCMMEHRNNILVNYDGAIYKCPGMIGRKEYRVGDIVNGIRDYRTSHDLANWQNEECLSCAYLPLCFGGCRYMKFVRDGRMSGVDCKRRFFDATLEQLVKQDIRYGLVS